MNRRRLVWLMIDGHEFAVPADVPAGRVGCTPMPQPRPVGTPDGAA